ncbi:hypothetical protein F3Y22_tig00112072pilonHSYRG00072 [Hibiscus syriacus]|uniref:Lipoyl-binding domain-containing protein n=1 Tax=Hibiscus syriacus TaxID=106335 RepID=A0A6A2X6N8_HIBSY|nr:hypothetical protein F3Y22_tig00112072pilonHSYRG00072 [Hibiscus syriacus]
MPLLLLPVRKSTWKNSPSKQKATWKWSSSWRKSLLPPTTRSSPSRNETSSPMLIRTSSALVVLPGASSPLSSGLLLEQRKLWRKAWFLKLLGILTSLLMYIISIMNYFNSNSALNSFPVRRTEKVFNIGCGPTVETQGFFRRSRTINRKRTPPSCKEKQIVKEGQVLYYIKQLGGEILIESDVSGAVIKILRDDDDSVGYGDALIALLPSFLGIKKPQ